MKRHTQKYILEHLEREGQMDISDFPEFCPSDVDNSVTDVDNNSRIYPCDVCIISDCECCDEYFKFIMEEDL